jgi:hypothetical protein
MLQESLCKKEENHMQMKSPVNLKLSIAECELNEGDQAAIIKTS